MATTKGGIMATKANNKPDGVKSMKDLVVSMGDQIQKALPTVITGERFTRMVLMAMSSNPQLQQCTPKSFLGAMMQAAQLGVEPNTPLGQAYLIPYKNTGTLECQVHRERRGPGYTSPRGTRERRVRIRIRTRTEAPTRTGHQ